MSFTLRQRSIGWAAVLLVCLALFIGLTIKVNSVRSEVRLAERRIIQLERQKMVLETEFQTRANQQQLSDWNAVDFGYVAPLARQFVEDERKLASLGAPRGIDAPEPIQMALGDGEDTGGDDGETLLSMVSPLTGQAFGPDETETRAAPRDAVTAATLGERLARRSGTAQLRSMAE